MYAANLGAERSVIGNILMNAVEAMPEAALYLTKNSFTNPICRDIFSVCLDLYKAQQPIDAVTVTSKAGGAKSEEYLKAALLMAQDTPTTSNFQHYIEIVKQCEQIRAAQEKTAALLTTLQESTDTEALRSQAADIASCFDNATAQEAVSAKDGFVQFMDNLDKPRHYISTGFPWLNNRIYFDKGKYMIVGGRPSSGKTALTLQMALAMAKKWNVVYFSLETGIKPLFERLAACYTGTSFSAIKQGHTTDSDQSRICEHLDRFSALRLHVVQAAGWTTAQIRAKAIQLKADVIFIDYLTLIQSTERNQYERATQISIDLHTMAQQLNIAVVALSQLNRDGDSAPDVTSLRESGQLEQDADIILLLHQEKGNNTERKLAIAKCKEGTLGAHRYHFDGDRQRFTDIETRYGDK